MDKKKIGVLGTGHVGCTLAKGFMDAGYEVRVGSRNGSKAEAVDVALGTDVVTGTFREVASWADLIILAVKGSVVEGLAGELADVLAHKTVLDVTNPLTADAPTEGVLKFFTSLDSSLGELVQAAAPEAQVVKVWNSVGYGQMINPVFSITPSMPLCGNDEAARAEVAALLPQFGWEPEDMGSMVSARAIEPLCMLWCIPGFQRGDWNHVFKIVRS
jgi:8-hydroxy-5-deazaflavin:NADPH oxidoreductase